MVDLGLLSEKLPRTVQTSSSNKTPRIANQVVRLDSAAEFCNFWHGAHGYPAISTFIAAVDKGWVRVPGLTARKLRINTPNPTETAAGHLDATRQGQRFTKALLPLEEEFPSEELGQRTIWHRVHKIEGAEVHQRCNHKGRNWCIPYQSCFRRSLSTHILL